MPTYEYACESCGVVEALQSMRDKPLTECPACHKPGVTRLISGGGGVIFKGDGFWETDYNRSADYKKKAKAPEAATGAPAPQAAPAAQPAPAATTSAPGPAKPAPPPAAG
jgi:putative FmdB family regulatory protein